MFDFFKKLFQKRKTSNKEKIISAIISFGILVFAGLLSWNLFDFSYYKSLIKSEVMPSDQVLLIIFVILFILLGLSGYFVWNYYHTNFKRKLFAILHLANGLLIYLWSYCFFGQNNLSGALLTAIGIIIISEIMIVTAFQNIRKTVYLLLPYLLFAIFATYLNATIISLN